MEPGAEESAESPDPRRFLARSAVSRALWLLLAYLTLTLGIIGIVLPGLPTTPFVLLVAFAAMRGSTRLHRWLCEHRIFGPMIIAWQREGAVSLKAKKVATLTMTACSVIMFATAPRWWMATLGSGIMLVVAIWLWRRPLPSGERDSASSP